MMRVLIIENMDGTPHGQIGVALQEAEVSVNTLHPYNGDNLPNGPDSFDGLIVLGGEQNALDDANYPYMPQLCDLIRSFVEADKSVLGVCLGSQLLARAYGGENLLNHTREFGWENVLLTDDGKVDPLLAELGDKFPIFQWHVDSFTLPENATRLAGNSFAQNQAFRIGRAAYGTQFHFEAHQNVVEGWTRDFTGSIEKMSPGWLGRFEKERERAGTLADEAGLKIARQWVKTLVR